MELDGLLSVQLHDGQEAAHAAPGMMLICLPLHSSTMLLERSMLCESSKRSVVDLGALVEGRMQWWKSCLWRQQATKP